MQVWTSLTAIDQFFAKRDPSPEEIEEGAKLCEQHGDLFPVLFKEENLTRKDIDLAIVLPKQIRELKIANLMLRLEEEGEHLHQVFNSLEKRFKNIKNRARRFWCMLKEYENSQGADKSLFQTARKG